MLADIVLKNGVIYTADEKDQIYQAIAIKDNRILFTGSDKEVQRFISNTTQVIDLEGKMVLPGLIDSHIHPPGLALSELYEVQLFNINTIEGLWKL
ncbi:amidohydrolase family protein [Pelosinus propionicus]|nr:amidohydrolase family protein [Pelosinus propionicus]